MLIYNWKAGFLYAAAAALLIRKKRFVFLDLLTNANKPQFDIDVNAAVRRRPLFIFHRRRRVNICRRSRVLKYQILSLSTRARIRVQYQTINSLNSTAN